MYFVLTLLYSRGIIPTHPSPFSDKCSCNRNRLFLAEWVVRKTSSFCEASTWCIIISHPSVYTHSFTIQKRQALCHTNQEDWAIATTTATATETFWCLWFSFLLCFFQLLQDLSQQVLSSAAGNNSVITWTPTALLSKCSRFCSTEALLGRTQAKAV